MAVSVLHLQWSELSYARSLPEILHSVVPVWYWQTGSKLIRIRCRNVWCYVFRFWQSEHLSDIWIMQSYGDTSAGQTRHLLWSFCGQQVCICSARRRITGSQRYRQHSWVQFPWHISSVQKSVWDFYEGCLSGRNYSGSSIPWNLYPCYKETNESIVVRQRNLNT